MPLTILCAKASEVDLVSSVLSEAADWVATIGPRLWGQRHVSADAITADVIAGLYYIAWFQGEAAGVVRLQLDDTEFWPEAVNAEAIYVHRLAVRRRYAGKAVSDALLNWAVRHCNELGRRYVRLDCAADRPSLRNIYERFGFTLHSERDMGRFMTTRYQMKVTAAT